MVKTDYNFEILSVETMSTTASANENTNTLGAALRAFKERIHKAGIYIEFMQPYANISSPREERKQDHSGYLIPAEIARCSSLIELTITQALKHRRVFSLETIGASITDAKHLVPGNVVGIYCACVESDCASPCTLHNGWLEMTKDTAKGIHVRLNSNHNLPLGCSSARFLVVDAGFGSIALYNPAQQSFLEVVEDGELLAGSQAVQMDDRPRAAETFEVRGGSGGESFHHKDDNVRLYNKFFQNDAWFKTSNNFYCTFQLVQVMGFDF